MRTSGDRGTALRVALVNWTCGLAGGAERYLQALVPRLLDDGHAVALAFETDAARGTPTIDAGDGRVERVLLDARDPASAAVAMRAWGPDVVYQHGLASPALEAALVGTAPAVLFAHNYVGTCATGEKRHTRPRLAMCTRRFGPLCLALDPVRGCGIASPFALLRSYRRQSRRHGLLHAYRSIVVASAHMRDEYLRHGVPADRVHVVALPPTNVAADPDPPAQREWTGRVLFLGRLTALKGGALLIPAVGRASVALGRPLRLVIAGTGPEEERWRRLASEHRVDAEFTGFAEGDRRIALLRNADVLAVPSVWPEPFGLTGIEAGCVGVPAVAFGVGGIGDWLAPGVSGEMAPGDPPTEAGLAEALVRALREPGHHAALRRGAWETARRFSMHAHLERLMPILRRAARGEVAVPPVPPQEREA